MFLGHFALGFAAKRAVPRVSLAMLFAAAQLADLLWPALVAVGFEQVRIAPGITAFAPLDFVSYPYSHSLLLLAVWGCVLGGLYRAVAGGRGTFVILALLVVSHWVLDFITHRPDMPLYPGGPKVGLFLWNSLIGTVAVEVPMFLAGIWIYFNTTRAKDRTGMAATFILLALLLVIYVSNVISQAPPPSPTAVALVSLIGACLITAWAGWADRHREVVPS